ncbi:MAG: hypothetical protein GQ574_04750 [Crocinitomix sp.]|nr:hypothetical protein [Crocinitomix sp.]
MIRILFISLLLIPLISFDQNKRFYEAIDTSTVKFAEEWGASGAKLDVLNFDDQNYEGAILDELNKVRSVRNRSLFIQDSAYNRMCLAGMETFTKKYCGSNKFRDRIYRYTEIGIRRMQGVNKVFRVFTFSVSLIDLGSREYFYFDRRNFDSELQLYKGNTPTTRNPDNENYVEPIPVAKLDEQAFAQSFLKKLKRAMGGQDLQSKNFTHIGLAMRLDARSVRKRRTPKALVMIILGGKQTQKVKKQRPIPQNSAADNNPYTILK